MPGAKEEPGWGWHDREVVSHSKSLVRANMKLQCRINSTCFREKWGGEKSETWVSECAVTMDSGGQSPHSLPGEWGQAPKRKRNNRMEVLRSIEICEALWQGRWNSWFKNKTGTREKASLRKRVEWICKSSICMFAQNAIVLAAEKELEVNKICKCIS